MTRARTAVAGAAALGAVVLVFVWWLAPPAARVLENARWQPRTPVVRGAYHVHTVRSDGTGTPDEVAAAAARAGLQFVIFTDHGDATRRPDPPAYRSGVLCLDAVEVSTNDGHYVALGIGQAPYPLGGDARDTVEDVARLGGFGFAAHPDSSKPALAWRDWKAPVDGVEWLNADSEWRGAPPARLAATVLTYPFRGPESLAALFRTSFLARLDALERERPLVAIAAMDAHARIGLKSQADPHTERTLLRVPSYETAFRAFSLHVTLDRAFSRRAATDADLLLGAIRRGHVHTIIDGFARNGAFEFGARSGDRWVIEGDDVPSSDAPILRVRTNLPNGRLRLLRDGREVSHVNATELVYATNRPGAYRAEAWLDGQADHLPWAASNAIFVGTDRPAGATTASRGVDPAVLRASAWRDGPDGAPAIARIDAGQDWHPEHDPTSTGSVSREGEAIALDYRVGSGPARSQFSALGHQGSLPPAARALAFRAVARAPMRVSVQLRVPDRGDGERWGRSIYLDATPRDFVVLIDELRAAGRTATSAPRLPEVGSILFVVDRAHAVAGAQGRFSIEGLRVLGENETRATPAQVEGPLRSSR